MIKERERAGEKQALQLGKREGKRKRGVREA
jgi:hypothetical protein